MSASLKLNADQLERLAEALRRLTTLHKDLNVEPDAYRPLDVTIDDSNAIKVRWDDEQKQYVIDDLVGG